MPAAFRLVWCVLLLSGCSLLNVNGRSDSAAGAKRASEIAEFANIRSIEELGRCLNDMCGASDAQQRAELLIQGWGQHGSWHDLAVVKFCAEHWPCAYSHDYQKFDLRRLYTVTDDVLKTQPELVFQVFWYLQWKSRPLDFASLMRDLEPPKIYGCVRLHGEEYCLAMLFAGVASGLPCESQPGDVISWISWEDMERSLLLMKQIIATQRPFLRYDHKLGRWIVDQEAKKENRYLTPDEQKLSPRPTPLPNWDSEVLPPRPIHEPEGEEDVELLGIPD